jgi:hypothetical protein
MYLGIVAVLVNSIWAGSLRRLWADARYFASTISLMLALFAIHAAMSGLSVRYVGRTPRLRVCTLAIAAVLFLAACARAISLLIVWLRGPWTEFVSQLVVPATAGLAFGYGFCAWTLWRIHTSTSRLPN